MSDPTGSYSLRRRLLIRLLGPLSLIGALALADAYYSARQTANEVFDRVLVGSALAISERVFVNEHNNLDVDIPYVALEMLTSAANDRIFYRIEGPDRAFITGYKTMALPAPGKSTGQNPERLTFSDSHFRGTPIRIAVLSGVADRKSVV